MGYAILEDPTSSLPHLECAQLSSVQDGLTMVNGRFELTESYVIPTRQNSDSHIMDGVCGSGLFTPGQIRKINGNAAIGYFHNVQKVD
jgi:hypothetical protein